MALIKASCVGCQRGQAGGGGRGGCCKLEEISEEGGLI
jgi:hypothetical protein